MHRSRGEAADKLRFECRLQDAARKQLESHQLHLAGAVIRHTSVDKPCSTPVALQLPQKPECIGFHSVKSMLMAGATASSAMQAVTKLFLLQEPQCKCSSDPTADLAEAS